MGRWKSVYENRTDENIKQEMLERIPPEFDKSDNSFIDQALGPASIKLAEFYMELEYLAGKYSVENLYDEELERFINERTGLVRRPATRATTSVTIQGQEGAMIQVGDIVASDTVEFTALETKEIDASGEMLVRVESSGPGSAGNVPTGAISYFPVAISGLISVTNTEPVTNGYDAESDESLLERCYQRIKTPATSGNKHHYMNWAKEVVGVGGAKVFPLWDGDNTVKVVIIDSNKQPASSDLVQKAQEYIDPDITGTGNGQAPIGAFCTIVSATGKPIEVSVNITRESAYTSEQVKENIEDNLYKYLQDVAFEENIVSYAIIGSTILSSEGVLDYEGLLVNGGTANIEVDEEEVAILGEVVLDE